MLLALLFVCGLERSFHFCTRGKRRYQQLPVIDSGFPGQHNRQRKTEALLWHAAKHGNVGLSCPLLCDPQGDGESARVAGKALHKEVGVPTGQEPGESFELVGRDLCGLQIVFYPESLGGNCAGEKGNSQNVCQPAHDIEIFGFFEQYADIFSRTRCHAKR